MAFKGSAQSRAIVEFQFHGTKISLESGWVAKQAGGAVIARAGETMVMATVCRADARPDVDFFPLTVEYQERSYAAGRIPGGFFKREGKPGENEILTCRLIDRPIRPMFPKGYNEEVQLICTVLSFDGINSPDTLAIVAASAALHISDAPFMGPVAGVRVGRVDGKFVINPSQNELARSDLEYLVAGTKDAIVMVEGGSKFVPEKDVLDALYFGHEAIVQLVELQDQLRNKIGKPKIEFSPKADDEVLVARVKELVAEKLKQAFAVTDKQERRSALGAIGECLKQTLSVEFPGRDAEYLAIFSSLTKKSVREKILGEKVRIDGRSLTEVRPIEVELSLLPRAHGSALFTRGETQAMVSVTLGTAMDSQRVDTLIDQTEKAFMLHYNFPPYCTGEVKMLRGTSRREVGHGALAERALRNIVPEQASFPYTVRIVSDITESNGSSSMASVCGGTLALMDAGVKIRKPVAGVAMGLIKEGDRVAVLTDILGDEDHYGDMDFKVCGSDEGVTALQMDIKCTGLSRETMEQALAQAKQARLHILGKMMDAIPGPRDTLSRYAPVIESFKINPDKIRDVIGPGGKTIKSIVESTGAKVDIEQDGTVRIASTDSEGGRRAKEIILGLTEEAEIGKVYCGVVKRIADFGAFVEVLPGVEGLVHISQLEHRRVESVTDVVSEGDEIMVRVLDIDRQGRIRLSRKDALPNDR